MSVNTMDCNKVYEDASKKYNKKGVIHDLDGDYIICKSCKGTGTKRQKEIITCEKCGGKGYIRIGDLSIPQKDVGYAPFDSKEEYEEWEESLKKELFWKK